MVQPLSELFFRKSSEISQKFKYRNIVGPSIYTAWYAPKRKKNRCLYKTCTYVFTAT